MSIYLPMIPELVYTMLACARIGAVHSIVVRSMMNYPIYYALFVFVSPILEKQTSRFYYQLVKEMVQIVHLL